MNTLNTSYNGLKLVAPDVERDAPISLKWLEGSSGRETLRLMGSSDKQNKPSTLENEKKRVRDFIKSPDQLTWMLQLNDQIIGSIWISLKDTQHLPAPSIHIMVGNPESRGQGVGTYASEAVIDHLMNNTSYDCLYSRYLAENQPAANLLLGLGFERHGELYVDKDGLSWQNVKMELTK